MENKQGNAQAKPKTYIREALINSEAFSMYQKDFLSALLTEDSYTLEAARKIADGFFGPAKKGK